MNPVPRTIARVGQFAYAQALHQALINRWIYTAVAVLCLVALLAAIHALHRRLSRPEVSQDNELLWFGVIVIAFLFISFAIAALLYWIDPQWQAISMLLPGNGF